MNNLGHLPTELLLLILDHVAKKDLYACTLINKSFYKEAISLLWRNLDIDSEDTLTKITTAMTTSPHSPGDYVRSVTKRRFRLSDPALLAFIQHVPFVEELLLEGTNNITDASFQHVPHHCPHLTALSICGASITRLSMVALAQHCHQLSTLELIVCHYLDSDMFSALHGCPLKELKLIGCDLPALTTTNNDVHLANTTMLLLASFQQLTEIVIIDLDYDYTPIISTATSLGLAWPHLTRVCLSECYTLDDDMATAWMKAHPRMAIVEWENCKITDRTLDAIITYLPNIESVAVDGNPGITAAGVCRVVKYCTKLLDGVSFFDCGIHLHDHDFPSDLDRRFYTLRSDEDEPDDDTEFEWDEVIWLKKGALDDCNI